MDDLSLIPAIGAGAFDSLIALHVGWNLNFLFLLDGDKQGKIEHDRYTREYGIPKANILTIDGLVPGVKEIEDLLDSNALDIIKKELGFSEKLTKNQIRRFFQERLSSEVITALGSAFETRSSLLLKSLKARLDQEHSVK